MEILLKVQVDNYPIAKNIMNKIVFNEKPLLKSKNIFTTNKSEIESELIKLKS